MIRFCQDGCKSLTKPKWQDSLKMDVSHQKKKNDEIPLDQCKSLTKSKWQSFVTGCKPPKSG